MLFRSTNPDLLLTQRLETLEYLIRDYTKTLVSGVTAHKQRIDELIQSYAQGWDFDRMPVVDRNLLRIAIYELLYEKELPVGIAISEAVELAKTLSTDDSAVYINGVLSTIEKIKDGLIL